MTIKLKLQIVRKDTKYESYRITIPRALIEAHKLRDKDFKLEMKGNKIILEPVKKVEI
ncbi:MAG: AbrB/MazE/SpoVT family DNA-binding domain-containing protein [Nanoarchaeota archaeon]|nr:AbrB/MazE/SpoVT family DNA-binding domain-containing protein [Nanoarchaeota archaeon]MBU4308580.1 AbrB/MazE/SpoVT family DNA-binding domain-containing protein [Nanoarchaeota archaeon]